jgi:phosphoribosylanthranilate isomerase
MNQIKLKVCGLRDNVDEVIALQPDYAGFIFYNKSPRYVGEEFAMPAIGHHHIKKIGVFVNESSDFVYQTMRKHQLDFAQLHGNESPQYCSDLKQKEVKIVKAFQVNDTFDFDQLKDYESVTDFYLFDTKSSKYGGSGKAFDWRLLEKYGSKKQYFLSGGLSLKNIGELSDVDLSKVHALDVNSMFEISPGLKNIAMLEELKEKMKDLSKDKLKAE